MPRITTYQSLNHELNAFKADTSEMRAVVIHGPAGTGKTTLRKVFENAAVIEAKTTCYGLFKAVHDVKDYPIIILDDLDGIWKDKSKVNLLKCLLQTDKTKRLSHNTSQPDREGYPRSFETQARVLVLCNVIDGNDDNFIALGTRLIRYEFCPDAYEVHREAERIKIKDGTIDNDIFLFIGNYLHYIAHPNLRQYINATAMKRSGSKLWREMLEEEWFLDQKLACAAYTVYQSEQGNPDFDTADKRADYFAKLGYGVRSTYHTYQAQILQIKGQHHVQLPKDRTSGPIPKSESPTIPQLPEATPILEKSASPAKSDEQVTAAFQMMLGKVPANVMRACKPKFRKRSKTLEQLKALPIELKREWVLNWQKVEDERKEQEELAARDEAAEVAEAIRQAARDNVDMCAE